MAGESKLKRNAVVIVIGGLLVASLGWSVLKERDRKNSALFRGRGDPAEPAHPQEIANALGIDASILETVPADPLPPAGDLKEEAAEFVSLDACVSQHARLDPLIGDSLRAIGYDTFIRDSCRTLDALRAGSKDKCKAIDASALRAHCDATVAIAVGQPDDCPFLSDDSRDEGREPFCVAVAARDARLCAALPGDDRTRCEATLARSARACGRSETCRRDVQRLGALVANDAPAGKPFALPHATLTIEGENGTESPAVTTSDMTLEVARGIVLVKARDRMIASVGHFGRSEFAPPSTNLRAGLRVSARDVGVGILERFEIDIPNTATLIFPGGHVEGAPTFDALEAKRGAAIAFTLDLHMSISTRSYHVTFRAETFVRDVVVDDKTWRLAPDVKSTVPSHDSRTPSRDARNDTMRDE